MLIKVLMANVLFMSIKVLMAKLQNKQTNSRTQQKLSRLDLAPAGFKAHDQDPTASIFFPTICVTNAKYICTISRHMSLFGQIFFAQIKEPSLRLFLWFKVKATLALDGFVHGNPIL